MAPKSQPKTLYQMSLLAMAELVDEGCSSALLNFGGYGSPECAKAIETMQEQLVSHLPLSTLEDLAEERNNSRLCGSRGVAWNRDARIKLSVFLHPNVTRFSVDTKGNELMQVSTVSTSQDGSDELDELFWRSQMGRMSNLVSLSLNLIATDEILVVVGRSCPKLEVVNIVSRIKQASHPHFSAITLKFCVSDIGLRALLQCQRLQRITMNKIINHQNSYQSISLQGIRELVWISKRKCTDTLVWFKHHFVQVRGLPHLTQINFCSMGKVIAGEEFDNLLPEAISVGPPSSKTAKLSDTPTSASPLRLRHFTELDPASIDVPRLQRLCPHVQHLSLTVPMSFDGSHSHVSASVDKCNEILQAVADSELSLTVLELQQFPFGDGFKSLLRKKGAKLDELLFRANGNVSNILYT